MKNPGCEPTWHKTTIRFELQGPNQKEIQGILRALCQKIKTHDFTPLDDSVIPYSVASVIVERYNENHNNCSSEGKFEPCTIPLWSVTGSTVDFIGYDNPELFNSAEEWNIRFYTKDNVRLSYNHQGTGKTFLFDLVHHYLNKIKQDQYIKYRGCFVLRKSDYISFKNDQISRIDMNASKRTVKFRLSAISRDYN
jgi:hypothetical protein